MFIFVKMQKTMLRRYLYISLILLGFSTVNAQQGYKRLIAEEYISLYKELAVVNMREKNVPASITLAQAMFESDCGNSALALNAKNHFGIKCHVGWNGDTFHQDDDAKDECFRKYENPLQSFEDHSDFLRSRDRYSFLFQLEITDYKGWARGLKEAGYATNPNYANKLIELIDRHKLYLLDEGKDLPVCKDGSLPIANGDPNKVKNEKKEAKSDLFYKAPPLAPEGMINGVPYIIAKKGDSFFSISKQKQMMLWQVLKYNDADKNDELKEGEIVFLKPKRVSAKEEYHLVKNGESMRSISQQHGVKLTRLYHHNKMAHGQEALIGQKISLK